MILLDPELDSDLPPRSKTASQGAVRNRSAFPLAERMPTPRTLARFLTIAQATVQLRGEVTVLLTTDKTIRALNRRFRGKNKATDVLSFPAQNPPHAREKTAGDLAISIPTARRQRNDFGHSLTTEIKVLILHGLLHLAGYDHETDCGRMARRELKLRAQLKLPQGLIERAGVKS